MTATIHRGMPMRDYLALPAVSASVLNEIETRCLRAGWHVSYLNDKREQRDSTDAQGIGTVVHSIVLEGKADIVQIVDADDWRTKAAKEGKAAAIAAGKIPLLPHQMPAITAMVASALAYIESLKSTQPAIWRAFQPDGGESEVVFTWNERDGTPCKMRPDRIASDRALIIDLKTTQASAEPDTWFRRTAGPLGYPLSAAFYLHGLKAAGVTEAAYCWLVIEQVEPYLCSMVGMSPIAVELYTRRMMRALRAWSAGRASGLFHAYPNDVHYPEIPTWEFQREEEYPDDEERRAA